MKVLFFGRYDSGYTRNRVLLTGLKGAGATIDECRVDVSARFWPLLLLWKFLRTSRFDVMLVPFPGHEVMLLARLICFRPIVFDAFTSHYEGYVLDRKRAEPGSLKSLWWRFLDIWSCRLANHVLLDTQAHIDFFTDEYHLPRKKFTRVFVGADEGLFLPQSLRATDGFIVHFCGTYVPLQGTGTIIRAAALLRHEPVSLRMIGVGQTYEEARQLALSLSVKNIEFIEGVSFQRLAELTADADICLGIFGVGDKALRVIPNKAFEALATSRPLITADTPAIRELLDDGSALLIRPNDPQGLADAIMRLSNDAQLRTDIAASGYAAFHRQASTKLLGEQVSGVLSRLLD